MTTTRPNRPRTVLLAVAAALLAAGMVFAVRPAPGEAAGTTPDPVNSVVLRMTGTMKLTWDKDFLKTLKKAKAKVKVQDGAKLKGRTATLPIDSSTTVSLSSGVADILGTGTVMFRRSDGRKVLSQDIALRLRDTGADVGATLRGRPEREFAALTISPTIRVQQIENGYQFVDVQMLVSTDMAAAAKKAHLKGIKAGALLGLLNVEVQANLPAFALPGISIGGTDITAGLDDPNGLLPTG